VSEAPRIALAGAGGEAHDAPIARPLRDRIATSHIVVAGLLVAALLGGMLAWANRPATNPAIAGSTEITADELEQQYGVRVDVVGILAGGGLIELQFRVIDADKATALFGEVEDMPVLAVEGSSTVLQSARGMKHAFTVLDGASYFFFYTNANNAVSEGSQVSFVVDGVRLAHLTVLQ
jgi:hypothetical protein